MRRLANVLAFVLCASCTQHESGIAGGASAGLRVLVVSDAISQTNKAEFDAQVEEIRAVFASIPGLNPKYIDVRADFRPSKTHGAGSRLGLVFDQDAPCKFRFTESNPGKGIAGTDELVAARDPGAYRYVVVYGAYKYVGCARNKVMFIDLRTTAKTIKHEMGHALGGLYDERGEAVNRSTLKADDANCTMASADPPWKPVYPLPQPGCDTSPALYHPSDSCIMISPGRTESFCKVCTPLLENLFGRWLEFSTAPAVRDAKRVTAVVTTDGNFRLVHTQPATALDRMAPVTSESFVVVSKGSSPSAFGSIVTVAPLSIDARPEGDRDRFQLHARAYAGEEIEKVVPVESALISFTVDGPFDDDDLTLRIRSLVNPGRAKLLTPQTTEALLGTAAQNPGDVTFVLPP